MNKRATLLLLALCCVHGIALAEPTPQEIGVSRSATAVASENAEGEAGQRRPSQASQIKPVVGAQKRVPYRRTIAPGTVCCAYCEQIASNGQCAVWSACLHGVKQCGTW